MKTCKSTVSSLIAIASCFFLFSCAGMRKMQEDIANSREKDKKAFVEKKDGEIVEANEAKLRSPLFGKSTIELDGDVKIPLKEVAAYQNNSAYYHTTPSGFAPRIKKGLVNVYLASETYSSYETTYMGTGAGMGQNQWRTHHRYVYYLQKGMGAPIASYTPDNVENYVNDYAPALDFMNDYRQTNQKVKTWSLINTAAVVGGLVLAGAAGVDNNNNVTAAGYAGTGLFLGGLVNGFVNKIRRAKNYKNLELAIDTYNGQVTKKRR